MNVLNNTPPSPAPQPPQTGDSPPTINDQQFDRLLALAVYQQNERRIEADRALAETNRGVMQAIIAVQNAPIVSSPLTKRDLVWQFLLHQPHIIGITGLAAVDAATQAVDGFLTRYPQQEQ